MTTRAKTGGRKVGSVNKVGATAKENIQAVFNRLGGTAGMAKWAADNQTQFYAIYAKLIPLQVGGDAANPIRSEIDVTHSFDALRAQLKKVLDKK